MKVVLTTIGSSGDVLPFVAIGRALGARGHAVHACSWRPFEPLFTGRGVHFRGIGSDFDLDGYWRDSIGVSLRHADPHVMLELAFDLFVRRDARGRFEACRGEMSGADLALCNSLDLVGQAAAESAGVPWCIWTSKPIDRATLPRSDAFFSDFDRRANVLIEAETGVGLGARAFRNLSRHETYFGASPALLPAFDLPPGCWITGTCFLDDDRPRPAPDVDDFLGAGAPPIVVTFGDFGRFLAASSFEMIVRALRRSGCRAIVHAPTPGDAEVGDDVLYVESIRYAEVFPHASAVVHHGGAGTAAEVCRAGVPSVTLPYLDSDQTFWAERLHALGVGTEPLMLRDATDEALLDRLRRVVDDTGLTRRARALGPRLQHEDGAGFIAARLEAFHRSHGGG